MNEDPDLRKTLDDATQAVTIWRENVAKISAATHEANARMAAANKIREQYALNATLQDAEAVKQVNRARREQAEAEASLTDLKIALEGAQAKLQEALREENSARLALNQHRARDLQFERIKVAAKLDAIFAEMADAYAKYEDLGHQIVNLDILPRSYAGVADHEGAMGARRVRAAMPKFMWRLFPGATHDEMKTEPLEVTEARHFGLNVERVAPESKVA